MPATILQFQPRRKIEPVRVPPAPVWPDAVASARAWQRLIVAQAAVGAAALALLGLAVALNVLRAP